MLLQEDIAGRPAVLINGTGSTPLAVVCEHASHFIPAQFNALGLTGDACESHAAWDPGAFDIAQRIAEGLNAPLVVSGVSRLVYDCNRPPSAPDAMPEKSELFDIPGNTKLSQEERHSRTQTYYEPFRETLSSLVANGMKAIITVHSFTPVYHGNHRAVELGVLHDTDTRLADAMLFHAQEDSKLLTLRNEPYGPGHGVTHTLKTHGIENEVPNVMLEIRNDLLETVQQREEISHMLLRLLTKSLADIGFDAPLEARK